MLGSSAHAYQLVFATGYANSGTPKTGEDVARGELFQGGSGYTANIRLEAVRPKFYWGPAFLFWNNVTGNPTQSSRTNYFQIEVGGRASYRTATIPDFYAGLGLGYTFAQGSYEEKFFDAPSFVVDGEFPSASAHLGVRTDGRKNGIGAFGELSYHWGLAEPDAPRSIGPANAYLVQIGVFFDSHGMIGQ